MAKLVATVGVNIGQKRFEPGETISAGSDKQRRWLVREGYALEVAEKARVPKDVKKAIEAGAASPHPVTAAVTADEPKE